MGYVLMSRPASDEYWLAGGGRTVVDGVTISHDLHEELSPDDVLGGRKVSEWPEGVTKVSEKAVRAFMKARERREG